MLPFVYKLLHVFTMSFKFMYQHVRKSRSYHHVLESRSEMTWRSAKRSAKTGSKNILHTTHFPLLCVAANCSDCACFGEFKSWEDFGFYDSRVFRHVSILEKRLSNYVGRL